MNKIMTFIENNITINEEAISKKFEYRINNDRKDHSWFQLSTNDDSGISKVIINNAQFYAVKPMLTVTRGDYIPSKADVNIAIYFNERDEFSQVILLSYNDKLSFDCKDGALIINITKGEK